MTSEYAAIIGTAWKNGETFKVHDWTVTVFLDLKEVTEKTAVNCTVDVSGENCNCNGILCGEGWERAV